LADSSFLAPVQTILPDAKTNAVVLGTFNHITTAANHLGLYSAFQAYRAIYLRFKGVFRLTVATIFYSSGY
jgi:hypothetical protein